MVSTRTVKVAVVTFAAIAILIWALIGARGYAMLRHEFHMLAFKGQLLEAIEAEGIDYTLVSLSGRMEVNSGSAADCSYLAALVVKPWNWNELEINALAERLRLRKYREAEDINDYIYRQKIVDASRPYLVIKISSTYEQIGLDPRCLSGNTIFNQDISDVS